MNSDLGTYKELSFAADLSNLKLVEEFVDNIVFNNWVDQNDYANILIAVSEAVNNAIQHGNHGDVSKKVRLFALIENDLFKIVVEDEGNGFDFENLPDPTAPENLEKENGRGVFLMRSLAENVVFENDGSKVELFFKSK